MSSNRYQRYQESENPRELEEGRETIPNEHVFISYKKLRRSLGILGFALPLVLLAGTFNHNANILPSISDYYYTSLSVVFTGIIITIGIFLFSHSSDDWFENLISIAAAMLAFLIVFFPTPIQKEYILIKGNTYTFEQLNKFIQFTPEAPKFAGVLHLVFAGFFFIILSILVLICFIKDEKKRRNPSIIRIRTYRICGLGMILCLVLIGLKSIFFDEPDKWTFPLTFTFESIILFLFGSAWLAKGEVETISIKQK